MKFGNQKTIDGYRGIVVEACVRLSKPRSRELAFQTPQMTLVVGSSSASKLVWSGRTWRFLGRSNLTVSGRHASSEAWSSTIGMLRGRYSRDLLRKSCQGSTKRSCYRSEDRTSKHQKVNAERVGENICESCLRCTDRHPKIRSRDMTYFLTL